MFRRWQVTFSSGDTAYERYPSALEVPWNYYEGCDEFVPANAKPARVVLDTLVFLYEVRALVVFGNRPCSGLTWYMLWLAVRCKHTACVIVGLKNRKKSTRWDFTDQRGEGGGRGLWWFAFNIPRRRWASSSASVPLMA